MFFIMWFVLFIKRKDLRRQMLFISIPVGIAASLLQYFVYTRDYWLPRYFVGTYGIRVGFEDFLIGFSQGGLAGVLYEVVFGFRLEPLYKGLTAMSKWRWSLLLLPPVSAAAMFFGSFYLLHWHSLLASIVAGAVGALLILIYRRGLFLNSLFGGLLLATICIPIYLLQELLFPGWIARFWFTYYFSDILLPWIPIEDLVYYFFVGAFLAPLYEFSSQKKLVKVGA